MRKLSIGNSLQKMVFWFSPQVIYPSGIADGKKLSQEYLRALGTFKIYCKHYFDSFFVFNQGLIAQYQLCPTEQMFRQ
jgi:hypothetical protein